MLRVVPQMARAAGVGGMAVVAVVAVGAARRMGPVRASLRRQWSMRACHY